MCTIAPGLIDTPLLGGLPDEARAQLAQSVLFPKRLGVPDDFASLATGDRPQPLPERRSDPDGRGHPDAAEIARVHGPEGAFRRMADHPTRADIDLLEGGFYVDDPGEKYAWMRANAPVYFDAKGGVWGFASYAAVLAASKDPKTFSNAAGSGPTTVRSR